MVVPLKPSMLLFLCLPPRRSTRAAVDFTSTLCVVYRTVYVIVWASWLRASMSGARTAMWWLLLVFMPVATAIIGRVIRDLPSLPLPFSLWWKRKLLPCFFTTHLLVPL